MSDPLTIGAGVLGLGGGIVGALGARSSGDAAGVASRFNQEIGLLNADQARAAAGAQRERVEYAGARILGAQKAGYGAAGVDLSSGSPLDVMGDTASQVKLAALNAVYAGDVAAADAENRANIAALTGQAARDASGYSAGASLLGGGASLLKAIGPEIF